MGCGKSKIKKIHLAQGEIDQNEIDPIETVSGKMGINGLSNGHHHHVNNGSLDSPVEAASLPNRLLAAMPVSDLGESLDSR